LGGRNLLMWLPAVGKSAAKELLIRQSALNAALDLDKNEQQVAEAAKVDVETSESTGFVAKIIESRGQELMR